MAPDLTPCAKCAIAAGVEFPTYQVLSPRGWLALLEREWLDDHPTKTTTFTYTMQVTPGQSWTY